MNSDEWILIDLYQYEIECKICKQFITIKQHGKDLNSNLLEKVLNEVHIKSNYDYFLKYENDIKIDIDIINKNCLRN